MAQPLKNGEDDAETILVLALSSHQRGEHDSAEIHYQRVLSRDPGNDVALVNYAAVLAGRKRFDKASALLHRAITASPDCAEAHSSMGSLMLCTGNPEKALSHLLEAITVNPNLVEAHINLASAHLQNQDFDQAISCLEKALALHENCPELHFKLGQCFQQVGQVRAALKCYQAVLRLDPDHSGALGGMGILLERSGHHDQAILCLRSACNCDPSTQPLPEVSLALASALQAQDLFQESIPCCEQALKILPDHCSGLQMLARAYLQIGAIASAINQYQRLLEVDPYKADTWVALGRACLIQGSEGRAQQCFQNALVMNPSLAEVHAQLSILFMKKGDLVEAERECRSALSLQPDNHELHSNLATILRARGDQDGALRHYRSALATSPENALIHSNLGCLLKEQGAFRESLDCCQRAILLDSRSLEAYSNLGKLMLQMGHLNSAAEAFTSLVSMSAERGISHLHLESLTALAIVHFVSGSLEDADRHAQKVLAAGSEVQKLLSKPNFANAQFVRSYCGMIHDLTQYLHQNDTTVHSDASSLPVAIHLGESHCLSFAHQLLVVDGEKRVIRPMLIMGAKAWHFASDQDNEYKAALHWRLQSIPDDAPVLISFGEIDCRQDQGILQHAQRYSKHIDLVASETVRGFVNYMETALKEHPMRRYYMGIPAAVPSHSSLPSQHQAIQRRADLIRSYNRHLADAVADSGQKYVDIYGLTLGGHGLNNMRHMCDDVHLHGHALPFLETLISES